MTSTRDQLVPFPLRCPHNTDREAVWGQLVRALESLEAGRLEAERQGMPDGVVMPARQAAKQLAASIQALQEAA